MAQAARMTPCTFGQTQSVRQSDLRADSKGRSHSPYENWAQRVVELTTRERRVQGGELRHRRDRTLTYFPRGFKLERFKRV